MNKTILHRSRFIHPVLNKTVLFIPSFCSFPSIHEQNPQSQYLQGSKGFSEVIWFCSRKKSFFIRPPAKAVSSLQNVHKKNPIGISTNRVSFRYFRSKSDLLLYFNCVLSDPLT
jgi:hypothetical protein